MFTRNLEQLRVAIHPGDRPSGRVRYPLGWSLEHDGARVDKRDSIHSWFQRCVDNLFEGRPELCTVEENLALFLVLRWEQRQLTYASCQALWTEGSLIDFYLDEKIPHQYLRMDFDPTTLGPLFKEALPHIHVVPDGEPRFGLPVPASGEVVSEFVDFVYRNYFHDEWLSWARGVWERECERLGKTSRFVPIADAYRTAKVRLLETELRDELVELKRCLARERRKLFPVPAAAERCRLLSHGEG